MAGKKLPQKPFGEHLFKCLLFPLQTKPMAYALLLSLGLVALALVPFAMPMAITEIGFFIIVLRYGCKTVLFGIHGIFRASEFSDGLDAEWVPVSWKFSGFLCFQYLLTAALWRLSPRLAEIFSWIIYFSLPAAAMVLIQSNDFLQMIMPWKIIKAIRTVGWLYAMPCFVLLLFIWIPEHIATAPTKTIRDNLPALLLILIGLHLFLVYCIWVLSALIGQMMYRHREGFDIKTNPYIELLPDNDQLH